MARRKVKNDERAPGDNVLPDQFQTVAAVLVSDWCQKAFVIFLCFCVFLPHTFKPWLLPRLLPDSVWCDTESCPILATLRLRGMPGRDVVKVHCGTV